MDLASKQVEMHGALRIERMQLASGKPWVMIFRGKAAKPIANYAFKSADRAEAFIASEKEKEAARVAYQATRKAERSAKAAAFVMPYKVGDVLHGSWGWEQTNCEFAQVVKILGKRKLVIQGISSKRVGDGYSHGMAENLVPLPGVFVGAELARVVDLYGGVNWNAHCSMHAWDGSPKYSSWYA
jgi:hypothetical protein